MLEIGSSVTFRAYVGAHVEPGTVVGRTFGRHRIYDVRDDRGTVHRVTADGVFGCDLQ